ncbi:MAG: hypothetical protein ACI8QC_002713 [Planctomycetota bacterium]|jgi:hypothetical protein
MQYATLATLALLASPASGQSIDWLTMARDDSRIDAPSAVGLADSKEKDFAWGDLDRDGWTDLVVVRKQANLGLGKRINTLFMNEAGVLTERTALYASASDVPGDSGFLTPTSDRDVVIVDIDGDGWDDVVTAASLSLGDPKHISHPRVYRNLGGVPGGVWNGLRYEEGRIPQLFVNGLAATPFFCGIGAGDVDGDGDQDLYFSDYSFLVNPDVEDRLLINDGNGYFTDETVMRLTAAMSNSAFGTRAWIGDINGDGANDILRCMGTCLCTEMIGNKVDVIYNDPNNVGVFQSKQTPSSGLSYFFSVGDLNRDELPDLVVANDFSRHRYFLNQGSNPFGQVQWGPEALLQQGGTSLSGSAGNTVIADLDLDGWNDVIVCDFEVSVGSCSSGRGTILFHNRGGTVGGDIQVRQELGSGYRGVTGFAPQDLQGMHDVAVFDLELDGDPDIVFGACAGMRPWLSELVPGPTSGTNYCSSAANSGGTPAVLVATGSTVVADNGLRLVASSVPAGSLGYFLFSSFQGNLPGFGGSQGVLCLGAPLVRFVDDVLQADEAGLMTFEPDLAQLPQAVVIQPGESWSFQLWYRDQNPSSTSNTSNGLEISFQ